MRLLSKENTAQPDGITGVRLLVLPGELIFDIRIETSHGAISDSAHRQDLDIVLHGIHLAKVQPGHGVQLLVRPCWFDLQRLFGHLWLLLLHRWLAATHINDCVLSTVDPSFGDSLSAIRRYGSIEVRWSGLSQTERLTYMHQQQPFCSLITTIRRMLLYIGSWYLPLVNGGPFWLRMVPCRPAFSCQSMAKTCHCKHSTCHRTQSVESYPANTKESSWITLSLVTWFGRVSVTATLHGENEPLTGVQRLVLSRTTGNHVRRLK